MVAAYRPSVYWTAAEIQQIEQIIQPDYQRVNPADWTNAGKSRPAFQIAASDYTSSTSDYYTYLTDDSLQPQIHINTRDDTVRSVYGNGQIAFRFGFLSCNLGYFQSSLDNEYNQFTGDDRILRVQMKTAQKLWSAGLALSPLPGLSIGVNYNSHHLGRETLNQDNLFGNTEWISLGEEKADYETFDAGISLRSKSFYLGAWATNIGDAYTLYGTGEGIEVSETVPLYQLNHVFMSMPLFTPKLVIGNHFTWQTRSDTLLVADYFLPVDHFGGTWMISVNAAFSPRVSLSGLYQYDLRKIIYGNIDPIAIYPQVALYGDLEPYKSIQKSYGGNLSFPIGKYQFSASVLKQELQSLSRNVNRASGNMFNLAQDYDEKENMVYGITLAANF